jgi:hypothetical protein
MKNQIKIVAITFFSLLTAIFLYLGLLNGGRYLIRHSLIKFPGTFMLSVIPLPKSIIRSQLDSEFWFVRCYTIRALNFSILRSKNVVLPILQEKAKSEGDELCTYYLANALISYGDTVGVRKMYTTLLNGNKIYDEARKRLEKLNKKL